jgi:prepilin-type processing-associated H-X9-DG protein
MNTHRCRGVTLIELMVLVLVTALLLALAVTIMQSSRCTGGRRIRCANNLRNIGLALVNFSSSKNCFPNAGTFHDDPADHQGDPYASTIYRALAVPGPKAGDPDTWLRSWVVDILPYIDAQDIYNAWNFQQPYLSSVPSGPPQFSNAYIAATSMGILTCPDDFTSLSGQGNLSYVVNGGFARWHAVPVGWSGSQADGQATSGPVLQWTPPGGTWEDNQAICKRLGVMFLGTHTGDQPWDIVTRPADIFDGMSNTLLVGENTLAGSSPGTPYSGGQPTNWACPLPNFTMFLGSDDVCRTGRSATDCLGGQLRRDPKGETGKGWLRANQAGTFENINFGQQLTVEGSFPFASSAHSDGSNFVFCDGAVRFLSRSIDGTVYARLLTSAGMKLPLELRQAPLTDDHFIE